jgi:hypothetical protein
MRILAAIPHYYQASDPAGGLHGSLGAPAEQRAEALTACIAALHQLYGSSQCLIDINTRMARPANTALASQVDVVVCTTGGNHLLDRLRLSPGAFRHQPTSALPPFLGFECHEVLRTGLGRYDYFVYLEDDLIARDPWLFAKLAWFNQHVGDESLLQPNRYEIAPDALVSKAYLDGDLDDSVTRPYQDRRRAATLRGTALNMSLTFLRPSNPHSGCFFLNARQMRTWAARADFLDRDTGFVGPLESAATLGIMRTFRVYKPAPENASFLEIEHHGSAFLRQLRLGE